MIYPKIKLYTFKSPSYYPYGSLFKLNTKGNILSILFNQCCQVQLLLSVLFVHVFPPKETLWEINEVGSCGSGTRVRDIFVLFAKNRI